MLKKGDCLKVKTKTKDNTFGDVIYIVEEVGMPCKRKGCGKNDMVKCVMLGGSGPAARPGFVVCDCIELIRKNMADGITEIISQAQAKAIAEHHVTKAVTKQPVAKGGAGGIEINY